MNENNMIGIVATITEKPHLILNAPEWDRKVYETKITRKRPSGTEDTLILQYDGKAAGSKKAAERLKEGIEVLVAGELRSENEKVIVPTKPNVKTYIHASVIKENDPPAESQNEVKLCGNICKDPRARKTINGVAVTDIMVAINGTSGSQYIPCICWQNVADVAAGLKKGTYVKIEGRFQSREYKKYIEGEVPFLMTAYEVSVIQLGVAEAEGKENEGN